MSLPRTWWPLVLALLLVGGCSRASEAPEAVSMQAEGMMKDVARKAAAPAADMEAREESNLAGAPAPSRPQQRPMMIRNASVVLQVRSAERALSELASSTARVGGFLSQTSLDLGSAVPSGQATARVPEPRLEAFLASLKGLGEVRSQEVTGEDVGEEYTDLQSRIRNWKAEEGRLLQLYAKAGRISDLLEVEREIARVRGEIEQAQGRARYLENRAALSTVTVSLSQPVAPSVPAGWSLPGEIQDAASALVQVVLKLVGMLIWIVVFVPIWGPILLLLRWMWRRLRARRQDRKPAGVPASDPKTL